MKLPVAPQAGSPLRSDKLRGIKAEFWRRRINRITTDAVASRKKEFTSVLVKAEVMPQRSSWIIMARSTPSISVLERVAAGLINRFLLTVVRRSAIALAFFPRIVT